MRTGTINLPLHGGKAPAWLFSRMKKLARCITICIIEEEGTSGFLKKISSPLWFQSLGCILGFDWHSSGLTTVSCAALKEGLKREENELGLFIAGGKGVYSRKTPEEIEARASFVATGSKELIYASRMSAKVDSSAVQDGYQIYQHMFFFNVEGEWTVVQQGMNPVNRYARRYHWLSGDIDFVCEPHSGIISPKIEISILNLVSKISMDARKKIVEIANEHPEKTEKEFLILPRRHPILSCDINPRNLRKIFIDIYERSPKDFEELLSIRGVGPKTLRALALLSELLYGTPLDFQDPARFSYAHGGKDGYPYPVDRKVYDKTISILERAIKSAKLNKKEELQTLRRLHNFYRSPD